MFCAIAGIGKLKLAPVAIDPAPARISRRLMAALPSPVHGDTQVLKVDGCIDYILGWTMLGYRASSGKHCAARQDLAFMSELGLVSRVSPVQTALRNCTRDEGRPFEVGNQVLISSRRRLLLSKAMVVNVAETSGQDSDRQG